MFTVKSRISKMGKRPGSFLRDIIRFLTSVQLCLGGDGSLLNSTAADCICFLQSQQTDWEVGHMGGKVSEHANRQVEASYRTLEGWAATSLYWLGGELMWHKTKQKNPWITLTCTGCIRNAAMKSDFTPDISKASPFMVLEGLPSKCKGHTTKARHTGIGHHF